VMCIGHPPTVLSAIIAQFNNQDSIVSWA
jgi:hypothetical protein